MAIVLKQIFAFLRLLNSENDTNPLAAGLALGLILGFSPFLSLQTFLVILLLLFFRFQMGAAFIAAFFFKLIAFLFDPLCDALGRKVLESEGLRPLFVEMYNVPLLPLTRFNNSIVMGSGLIGFLLCIPAFIVFKILIIKYRATVVARFKGTRVWKVFTATGFYKWYVKYEELTQ